MEHIFDSIVSQYEDKRLQINKKTLYENMKDCKLDFRENVSFITINQANRKRRVLYSRENSLEEITLKYLKKRLDAVFNIIYPDRKKIMKECFGVIESLHKMGDYAIFKLDFRDFFESISSKIVFEKYLKDSDLLRHEKDIIKELVRVYDQCFAGIPTSNALVEIISREFDVKLKSLFKEHGLIFYSRYVDDGLIIFNKKVNESFLLKSIDKTIEKVFNNSSVKLNSEKTAYYSKENGNIYFTYLGYEFEQSKKNFKYGIDPDKLEKYRKKLKRIVLNYKGNKNVELFRQRLLFFSSRIVFYNNFNSKYSNQANWDVIGVIANYSELRHFIENKKITNTTKEFLQYEIITIIKKELKELPYFLKGRNESYQLINRFKENKSLVFHPNIGWPHKHLYKQIEKITPLKVNKSKSYRELVKFYCRLLKV